MKPSNSSFRTSPLVRLHFLVFLWGFTGIIGALISLPALPMVWVRILVAFCVIYFYLRFKKISIRPQKKTLKFWILAGVIVALHWVCFFYSIKVANVSIGLSTLSTGTLFVALLEPLFFKEKRLQLNEIVVSIVIIACISVIFQAEVDHAWGIVIGLTAACLSALFTLINGKIYANSHSGVTTFYELVFGWLFLCLILSFVDYQPLLNLSLYDGVLLFVLGSVLTAYPMIESVSLLKNISPFTLILAVNLEPIYGIVLAFFIFNDSQHMSSYFYVATAVILLTVVLNSWYDSHQRKKAKIIP